MSIVGPSGCGKSTLLRIIDGLVPPTEGQVLVGGAPVTRPTTSKGFIFQEVGLFPWRTAIENTEFFLELKNIPKKERKRIAMEKLELVGLEDFANYPPVQLSGGMQQKVAIARALCTEPDILLMDEPFGALDALGREKAQKDLLQILSKDKERSILFVTHSIEESVFLSNKVVVFSSRPGSIKEIIDVDLRYPRWEGDLRSESKFADHCRNLRHALSEEAAS